MRDAPTTSMVFLASAVALAAVMTTPVLPFVLPFLPLVPWAMRQVVPGLHERAMVPRRWAIRLGATLAPFLLYVGLVLMSGVERPAMAWLTVVVLVQTASLTSAASADRTMGLLRRSILLVVLAALALPPGVALATMPLWLAWLAWTRLLVERDPVAGRVVAGTIVRRVVVGAPAAPTRRLVPHALRFALAALPLTLLLFLAAPRNVVAMLRGGGEESDGTSLPSDDDPERESPDRDGRGGLSGPRTIGDDAASGVLPFGGIARIQGALRPYFEVVNLDAPGPPRGVVLRENSLSHVHDDGSWASPSIHELQATRYEADRNGVFDIDSGGDPAPTRRLVIDVLQGGHRRLYLEERVVDVRIVSPGAAPSVAGLSRRDDGTWLSRSPLRRGDRILQTSRPPVHDRERLVGRESSAAVSPGPEWLQLPETLRDEILAIARDVVGDETDPWLRARRIESWLQGPDFVYSLAQPPLDPTRRVADFLRRVRRGHCECYATSLVVLLRALGHPARYVRGFWGGEPTSAERASVIFRGIHYHAWAEIYLHGPGWITLNPTPPTRIPIDASTTRHGAVDAADGGGSWFDLDQDRWAGFWKSALGAADRALRSAFGSRMIWATLALALVLAWATWRLARARTAASTAVGGVEASSPYTEMIAMLREAGIRRSPSDTPREFETAVLARAPRVARPLRRLTAWEELVRYGGAVWPDTIRADLEALRAALARPGDVP